MLLDTSGLLACFDASEACHRQAISVYDKAAVRLTHSYVLAEFVALAQARHLPREKSIHFAMLTALDPRIEMVWVDRVHHDAGMALLAAQLDKSYSLCDAISFVLMRNRGVQEALSTDHHFEQAGFTILLE